MVNICSLNEFHINRLSNHRTVLSRGVTEMQRLRKGNVQRRRVKVRCTDLAGYTLTRHCVSHHWNLVKWFWIFRHACTRHLFLQRTASAAYVAVRNRSPVVQCFYLKYIVCTDEATVYLVERLHLYFVGRKIVTLSHLIIAMLEEGLVYASGRVLFNLYTVVDNIQIKLGIILVLPYMQNIM